MSTRSLSWPDIISGILATLTAITTYLGTKPFDTLFAVSVGAAITYSVQNRLQRQTEKRSKNAEYVEKYYGPLLIEIQKIQEDVLSNVVGQHNFFNLDGFKTLPQFYTMGKKLSADFLVFTNEIKKFVAKTDFYRGKAKDLIREKGHIYLVNPSGKICNFVSDNSYSPIYLRYRHESEWLTAMLDDCILCGKSPSDIVKDKVTNFQEQSLKVEFFLECRDVRGGSGNEYDRKSFPERKEVLSDIVLKVNAELDKDDGYKTFQSELHDLRQKAVSLSARLSKYVGKYVSIVDV